MEFSSNSENNLNNVTTGDKLRQLKHLLRLNESKRVKDNFIILFTWIIFAGFAVAGLFNYLYGNSIITIICLSTAVFTLPLAVYCNLKKVPKFQKYYLSILVFGLLMYSQEYVGMGKPKVLWFSLFIAGMFIVGGRKWGRNWSVLVIFSIPVVHILAGYYLVETTFFSPKDIVGVSGILLLTAFLLNSYFKVLEKNDKIILLAGEQLFGANKKLIDAVGGYERREKVLSKQLEQDERLIDSLQPKESKYGRQHQILQNLFRSMSEGVVVQDAVGKIVLSNPAANAILELPSKSVRGRDSKDPSWMAIREDGTSFPGEEHPAMVALRTGKSVQNVVMGLKHPDHTRWISVVATPLFETSKKKPSGVVATFRDITDEKENSTTFDTFFTISSDLIGIANSDGYFKRINPSFNRVLGYSDKFFLSKPFMYFVHPDDVAATQTEISKLMKGAKTLNFENRFKCKDGSYAWLQWDASPRGKDLFAIARDITEEKKHLINLERLNNVMIDRELRMVEMKKEIAKLKGKK